MPNPPLGQMPEPFANAEIALIWGYISRTLDRLIALIDELPDEILDWRPDAPDTNSIFALGVHTTANAYENLAGTLCGESILRDHAAEFSATTTTRQEFLDAWRFQRRNLETGLARLGPDAMHQPIQHPRRGPMLGLDVLLIVARHSAEHLGHAELTRDLALVAQRSDTSGQR